MKTRVTFRLSSSLADALRELPNQTAFVESAIRDALRTKCPTCAGTGRISDRGVRVSNFKQRAIPKLDRASALQLKGLVGLARRTAATRIDLEKSTRGLSFAIAREDEVLLSGTLDGASTSLRPN